MPAAASLLGDADVRALERLSLVSLEAIRIGLVGQREGPEQGAGVEFADHRPYALGDDVRRIDWSIYARLRELLVKTSPVEAHLWLSVLLDASASMDHGEPNRLAFGRRLAVLLGVVALLHGDAVQVHVLSDGSSVAGGRIDTPAMLDALAAEVEQLPPGRGTQLERSIGQARTAAGGAEVAVLISDGLVADEDRRGALAGLGRVARAAAFIHVVGTAEEELGPAGTVELRDRESGERLVVAITEQTRDRYAERLRRFRAQVEEECRIAGVRYLAAPASADPLAFVLGVARGGELIRARATR